MRRNAVSTYRRPTADSSARASVSPPACDSGARMAASLVEQLGVDALLPGPPLIHQRAVQPAQGPHLHHVCWRDPRLRQPVLQQHGAASAAQMRSAAHALCNSTVIGNNTWVTLHGRQRARYGRSGSLSPSICRARAYPSRPTHLSMATWNYPLVAR